jgi:hypothetical protein
LALNERTMCLSQKALSLRVLSAVVMLRPNDPLVEILCIHRLALFFYVERLISKTFHTPVNNGTEIGSSPPRSPLSSPTKEIHEETAFSPHSLNLHPASFLRGTWHGRSAQSFTSLATAACVQAGIIAKTLRLALLGIAIGTLAAFAVARGMASLLFGTEPTDPANFAGTILILSAVAFSPDTFQRAPSIPHQPHDRPSGQLRNSLRIRPAILASYAALFSTRSSVLGTEPCSADGTPP